MSEIYNPSFIEPNRNYQCGLYPVSIDSRRYGRKPYAQYALYRGHGENSAVPGVEAVKLLDGYDDTSGPRFLIVFTPIGQDIRNVSPESLLKMIRPTLAWFPIQNSEDKTPYLVLEWEDEDSQYNMWRDATNNTMTLKAGYQYVLATKPLQLSTFEDSTTAGGVSKAGIIHFTLEPTKNTEFDGKKLGLVAVLHELKLVKR